MVAIKRNTVNFDVKGRYRLHEVMPIPEPVEGSWEEPCYLFLDQATNTGYAIYDNKNRLIQAGDIIKKDASLQAYKFELKNIIEELVEKFGIKTIFYEETYDSANMWTTEVLMYIKHMIQDLVYLRSDLEGYGLDHSVWKRDLAKPDKFVHSGDDKKEVLKFVKAVYPLVFIELSGVTISEHMVDSIGMGIAVLVKSGAGSRKNFLNSVRYNKKLPLQQILVDKDETKSWEEYIAGMRKPFRDAYEIGGLVELELQGSKMVDDQIRRLLTHRDSLAVIKIPYTYRHWGVLLLEHGWSPSVLNSEDKSFWLVSSRKKRK